MDGKDLQGASGPLVEFALSEARDERGARNFLGLVIIGAGWALALVAVAFTQPLLAASSAALWVSGMAVFE